MGLRDLFIKRAVGLTSEHLSLLLEAEEKPPLAFTFCIRSCRVDSQYHKKFRIQAI